MFEPHTLTAILPCNNVDASQAFYQRLGFTLQADYGDYRLLADGKGCELHLNAATEGCLIPGRNPFGLYLYTDEVDALAAAFAGEMIGHGPEHKPWKMYEFALSDPDETLVRIGCPSARVNARTAH